MHDEAAELDRKGLREFGLIMGGIVAVLFGLFFPWMLDSSMPVWPWVIAATLVFWGLAAPMSLQPVYRLWMKLGLMIGKVTTPIILGIVFYLLIFPMGLIMRLFRPDPMARQLDETITTYRVVSRKAPKENMEKPF